MTSNLIVVLGPTATGKTRFAAHLAHTLGGEVISADSRQVYRRMDLGTGKDYGDYVVEGHRVSTHLLDICDPGEHYDVYRFQMDFYAAFEEIRQRERTPILCGGTGMYIEAVTKAYRLPAVPLNEAIREALKDKSSEELQAILAGYGALHNSSDTQSRGRALRAIEIADYGRSHPLEAESPPDIRPVFLGLELDPVLCRERIRIRLSQRLDEGLVDEVNRLLEGGLSPKDVSYYGLEYKFVTRHLTGEVDYQTMVRTLFVAICQFAKRQRTWFRKMERNGAEIHWLDARMNEDEKVKRAMSALET